MTRSRTDSSGVGPPLSFGTGIDSRRAAGRISRARYDALAKAHFDEDAFLEFNTRHLGHLDEVAHTFFGTPQFKEIVRAKVAALFPKHEIDAFTEHFYAGVQDWRRDNPS